MFESPNRGTLPRMGIGVTPTVSLAELLATLSLGTDLGLDRLTDHVMRQTLVSMRLAELVGMDETERASLYYAGLLAWVGCHVDAYEQARWFGDDTVFKADARTVNGGGSLEEMRFMFGHLGAGRPALERVKIAMSVRGDGWYKAANEILVNHTLATDQLGRGLGRTAMCSRSCSTRSSGGMARAPPTVSAARTCHSARGSSSSLTLSRSTTVSAAPRRPSTSRASAAAASSIPRSSTRSARPPATCSQGSARSPRGTW